MDEQLLIDDVGATITGQDNVLVRDRASTSQKNSEAPHGSSLVAMEGDEWIPEEKAICRICFSKLAEENTVKSECRCTVVLVHEECANNWSSSIGNTKCDLCWGEVNNTPVTLLRGFKSAQKTDSQDSIESGWGFIGFELYMEGSSRQPALFRGRAYIGRIKLPDGATSTRQDIVIVRDKASASEKNSKAPHSSTLVAMEGDEWIEDEEAICRICFSKLGEENTFKSKCRCTVVFEHEECATNKSSAIGNTQCDFCWEEANNTPVTLLRGFKYAQKFDPRESTKLISLLRCERNISHYTFSSLKEPSFTKRGADLKLKFLDVGATITRGIVIVRDRDSASQTNPKVVMEGDKGIAEEGAICRICFSKLENAALKSNCRCGELLTHEKCVTNRSTANGNNNCHYCKQEANNIPVTLLRCLESAQLTNEHESTKRQRWWSSRS